VNTVNLQLKIQLPSHIVIQIKNHLYTPYKILGEFFVPDTESKMISLPIITKKKYCLVPNDILTHWQLQSVDDIYPIFFNSEKKELLFLDDNSDSENEIVLEPQFNHRYGTIDENRIKN
jgi:hypothetical protein